MPQTILLVDDEFGFLEAMGLLLGQEGYEVVTASDGVEALARLQERTPDLIITDYWMPRMNGIELGVRIKEDERWSRLPVILMTAIFESDEVRTAHVAGVISKPIDFKSVMAVITRVLGAKAESE